MANTIFEAGKYTGGRCRSCSHVSTITEQYSKKRKFFCQKNNQKVKANSPCKLGIFRKKNDYKNN